MIPDHASDVLVHFGEEDFLSRYRKFEEHLPEWRVQYPKLSSVDMRYERQVVLEMQPGAILPSAAQPAASISGEKAEPVSAAPAGQVPRPLVATTPKPHAGAQKPAAGAKGSPVAPAHAVPQNDVAFDVPANKSGAKAKPHAAPAKRHTGVVGSTPPAPLYHPPQVVHP